MKELEPLSSVCARVRVRVCLEEQIDVTILVFGHKVRSLEWQCCFAVLVVSVPAISGEREVVNSHTLVCPTLCAGMLGLTGLMMSVGQGERILALASGVCIVLMGKSMSNFWFWSQKFELWSGGVVWYNVARLGHPVSQYSVESH